MSHIMFGVMKSSKNSEDLKKYMKIRYPTINILTGKDVQNDDNIMKMLKNNILDINNYYQFLFTSKLQPFNSDDLLFPYSKFSNEYLFCKKENFVNEATKNLNFTFEMLKSFSLYASALELKIFVTETYDDNFEVNKCSFDEMKENILKQVLNGYYISSSVYIIE